MSQTVRPPPQQQYLLSDDDDEDSGEAEQRGPSDLAELLHEHLRLAAPSDARRQMLDMEPCPCEGSFDDGEHCVFLAFLHYDNDEYRVQDGGIVREQCMESYRMLPMNWLTTKLSGSDIYHAQFFYWNNEPAHVCQHQR